MWTTNLPVIVSDWDFVSAFPQVVHKRVPKQVRLRDLEGDHHVLLHIAFILQQFLQTLMKNLTKAEARWDALIHPEYADVIFFLHETFEMC